MEQFANGTLVSTAERDLKPEDAVYAGTRFGIKYHTVAVIRDSDPSSEMVAKALISGLLSAGADVLDAGRKPVPEAYTVLNSECELILSVGNPDRDGHISGISAYSADGSPLTKEELSNILKNGDFKLPDFKHLGHVTEAMDLDSKYIEKVKSLGISSQGYVILDCGCGSTSTCAPHLLENLGADVVAFNTHEVGEKLPRAPGLNKTDLMHIASFVNASIGSIGIAFNSDGTRIALIDESGKYVPGDRLLALMLMYYEPQVAVVPFDSPYVVEDAFKSPLGMRRTPVDPSERRLVRADGDIDSIIQAMKDNDAEFGALADGTFIFSQLGYCPDALFAASILSELSGKRSIRNVLEEIPVYSNRTLRIDFDGNMTLFSNKLRERLKNYDVPDVEFTGLAWKILLKHGSYTIKQAENNPEKLVVFAESSDVVYLITMLEQAKDIIHFCI